MPKKAAKRSLSVKSSNSVRKKRQRDNETEGEQRARLDSQKDRQELKRQNETEEESDARKEYERIAKAKKLKAETSEQKEERLSFKRENRAQTKEKESEEDRKNKQKVRQAKARERRATEAVEKTRNVGLIKDDTFNETQIPKEMAEHRLPCIYDANNVCFYCKAYRFKEERSGFCCENGQVKLPLQQDIPEELQNLYNNSHFLDNIRQYNNALALASIGCQEEVLPGFSPTVKIHGKVFHRIGALHPPDGQKPKFAQIYFH